MQYVETLSKIYLFMESVLADGGYIIIFGLTTIEGIPLVGMAIPGHLAILFGGFLAKVGTLNLFSVIVVSLVGALIGDFIGFIIGKKYGMDFIKNLKPYLFLKDEHIAKACLLLSKHTGKSLIIGRFTPATRALMPFLVGTSSSISLSKFWLYNIIGGFIWVNISIFIGYTFGSAYHIVSRQIGKVLLIAIIITIILIWGYRFANKNFHLFRHYELFTLIINIVSLLVLATTIDKLTSYSFKLNLDIWINSFIEKIVSMYSFLIPLAKTASALGGVYSMAILGIILGSYFFIKKKWRSASIVIMTTIMTALISGFIKIFFMNPRPIHALELLFDPSFPSSHATMSAGFFMILIYLFAPKINHWIKREMFIVISVLIVILIGLSRLILNVHWFSDIIGGWSLGLFIGTASILLVRYVSFLIIKKNR